MRTEARTWDMTNGGGVSLCSYKPINERQAHVSGVGKVWNDRIRKGDSLLVKTREGKGLLVVDEIDFTNEWFEATVTLGDLIEDNG